MSNDFLQRAQGILDLAKLGKSKIAFWGLGSLNSKTLGILAYPWKEIVLCDPQDLEAANLERHLLTKQYLGRNKAEACADWLVNIRGLDPAGTKLTVHKGRAQESLHLHPDTTIAVVGIDHLRTKQGINQALMRHNIPALYGGAYPRGAGGKVIFIPDPARVCYNCAQTLVGSEYRGKDPTGDYGIDPTTLQDSEGNLRAVPALAESVEAIASDMADIVTDFMEGKGGDLRPQIQIRAIDDWGSILVLYRNSPLLPKFAAFIGAQEEAGLAAKMRFKRRGGRVEGQIAQGTQSLILARQDQCPYNHDQTSISLANL